MNTPQPFRRGADILAIAFAATVAMWTLLYLAALPSALSPGGLLVSLGLVACLFAAGYVAGRYAGRGLRGGAALGLVLAAISSVILVGLLGADTGDRARNAGQWIGGFLLAAVGLGALGATLGEVVGRGRERRQINWTSVLTWVTAVTLLLMLASGGIVTGLEAGLAVDGWLIAEGHFLVLFPMTLMQRDLGTFVEHAHRLWGLLVGLTTIVLMVHLWMVDRRRWVRGLSVAIVLAVIVQGVLGGTRVTEQSVALGIAHGVFAQLIFAALFLMAQATSTAWTTDRVPTVAPRVRADRALGVALVAMIVFQIGLGTMYRHLQPVPDVPTGALMGTLHGHSFVSSLGVVLLVLFCGVRAWGLYADEPIVRRAGLALVHTMILQVILGVVSFVVVPKGLRGPEDAITFVEVGFTTAHQVMGAVLLAMAVALVAWERRLLRAG